MVTKNRVFFLGNYFDVAVRDLVMAVGAFTLVQLTKITEHKSGV